MARRPGIHWPTEARTVFFGDVASPATISRAVKEERIRRLAPRVYTADLASPAEEIVASSLWKILGYLLPGALIADRSAAEDGRVVDGRLFVIAETDRRSIRLPGVEISIRPGRPYEAPIADPLWSEGLRMSSSPRILLDNLKESHRRGKGAARTLKLSEVEDWLARKAIAWDRKRIERLHDETIQLARAISADHQVLLVDRLFDQLTGQAPLRPRTGPLFQALSVGRAWDERRVEMFDRACADLRKTDTWGIPDELPASLDAEELAFYESYFAHGTGPGTIARNVPEELAFYESYFSNYIEGTEFTLEEARQIIDTLQPPPSRPADGHDILGTYNCVSDPVERSKTSDDVDRLIESLIRRHETIMAGRPTEGPGMWKTRPNRVGGYDFVKPELVEGTLRKGLSLLSAIEPGFKRALYVLFVFTEVHPFADGNGRVSRVMMNAELSHVGQARIVIPNVFRNEYISGLRRASVGDGDIEALARVLAFAWRWTAAMPWSDRAATEGKLHATNALIDSTEAEQTRIRLELP